MYMPIDANNRAHLYAAWPFAEPDQQNNRIKSTILIIKSPQPFVARPSRVKLSLLARMSFAIYVCVFTIVFFVISFI